MSRMITRLSLTLSVKSRRINFLGHSTQGTSTCRRGHGERYPLASPRARAPRRSRGEPAGAARRVISLALSDGERHSHGRHDFISSYSDDVTSPAASERARGHRRFAHVLCHTSSILPRACVRVYMQRVCPTRPIPVPMAARIDVAMPRA